MYFKPIFYVLFAVIFANVGLSPAAELTPNELMEKNRLAQQFNSLKADCVLKTSGGKRRPSEKKFTWLRKRQENKIHFNTLTTFKEPAEIKGQAILFLERTANKNEISMYLPAYKKVRRVEASQQKTGFMSSDFSYADMTTFQNKEYDYRDAGKVKCPTTDASTIDCRIIESKPKDQATIDRTGYSKSIVWVRVDQNTTTQVEHYDADNKLLKRLIFESSKLMGKGDDKQDLYFAHHLLMHAITTDQKTDLAFDTVEINKDVKDSLFDLQNFGK